MDSGPKTLCLACPASQFAKKPCEVYPREGLITVPGEFGSSGDAMRELHSLDCCRLCGGWTDRLHGTHHHNSVRKNEGFDARGRSGSSRCKGSVSNMMPLEYFSGIISSRSWVPSCTQVDSWARQNYFFVPHACTCVSSRSLPESADLPTAVTQVHVCVSSSSSSSRQPVQRRWCSSLRGQSCESKPASIISCIQGGPYGSSC